MGPFILSVVVDVLVHVPIQLFHCVGVIWIPHAAWFFAILDSSEFVVLNPEIRLEYFGCCCEPKKSSVSLF